MELGYLQHISAEVEALQRALSSYKSAKKELDTLYQGEDVEQVVRRCQEQYTQSSTKASAMAEVLDKQSSSLRSQEQKLATLQTVVSSAATKLGYSSTEDMQAVILPVAEIKEIKELTKAYGDKSVAVKAELAALEQELETLVLTAEMEEDIGKLRGAYQTAKDQLANISKALGGNNQLLANNDKQLKYKEKINADLHKLQEEGKVWVQLNDMIGDSTGSKYSNFAQDLTLRNLIALSNQRLSTLTDRYLIDMPSSDSDYLRVVDLYQGNVTRAVTTLSGGETFLLSLALALSLSDMASRNVQLHSLFIDEGFGTLDQETLETAISTLERLQADSDKTIGIISHVEALKERITTQIVLRKSDNGISSIDIVA